MNATLFILKKIVARLLFPVGLVLMLGFLGLALGRGRARRLGRGRGLIFVSLLLLFLLSLPLTGYFLLGPLERAAGDYADPARLQALGVTHIVVLGGGVRQDGPNPYDRLSPASLYRLLEGMRLWRGVPGSRLVLSGGRLGPAMKEAVAMAQLARRLGVPDEAMILETNSWDTADQARALAPLLGGRPFALVTSAYHMPRALALFRAWGLKPLPAPTDFRTRGFVWSYNDFIPQAGGLKGSETAIYEYLGRIWAWLAY